MIALRSVPLFLCILSAVASGQESPGCPAVHKQAAGVQTEAQARAEFHKLANATAAAGESRDYRKEFFSVTREGGETVIGKVTGFRVDSEGQTWVTVELERPGSNRRPDWAVLAETLPVAKIDWAKTQRLTAEKPATPVAEPALLTPKYLAAGPSLAYEVPMRLITNRVQAVAALARKFPQMEIGDAMELADVSGQRHRGTYVRTLEEGGRVWYELAGSEGPVRVDATRVNLSQSNWGWVNPRKIK